MSEPAPIGWRLGCGGLFLGGYGLAAIVLSLLTLLGQPGGGLIIDEAGYELGEAWFWSLPLGAASVVAVARLIVGHRDWLGAVVAGLWVVTGIAWALQGESPNLAGASALITAAWIGGTWAARRAS